MSLKFKIDALYHRAVAYMARVIGSDSSEFTVPFVPDITRYFLSEAIEDRIKFLSREVTNQEPTIRDEVTSEYRLRVENAIRQELKAQSHLWIHFVEVETRLGQIKLPSQFNDDIFETREALLEFLRQRMVFFPGRFAPYEALVVAGILLRAIQQVTLDIIRVDYPPAGPDKEVRPNAQKLVRKVLGRLDELQRLLQTPIELKSATKAETELRVLVARARGVACLPLRPIPTAPLSSDETSHYVGRPEDEASKLARQIRHADGTILVTGYRGVGKSSYVNRVIYHVREAQKDIPSDGWLIVPITVNLAKVAGVQNILRITLRSVREALIEPDSRKAKAIPGHLKSTPLPLSQENEIEPLEEAYIRATYKVTMSRSTASERRWDIGSSISIDPGKLLGRSVVGVELGKFLETGIKKTKTEKINRELNPLDFDENAAEESLARLIRGLATRRPLFPDGPEVRIKLVFVFDELDKMDVDTGLKPMIEGLKNLFLQQYSVFMLVTSKKFYYDLLKDRAVEDAMMNSYFSSIVHVPLLSYEQARKMVEDWVDRKTTEQLKTLEPAESKLIDQLTRVLVYRSFGNPRDIIRELRLMQDWADTADQPYLTDRLSKSPNLQIFAAIQDCIEKTVLPQQATSILGTSNDDSVMLVAERLVGNEARLEQVRRGLYILTEELINRQTLSLETSQLVDAPLTPLQKIQQDNFSLLSMDDVRQLSKRLGGYLSLMHDNPDLFSSSDWGPRAPLFEMQSSELRVNNEFYTLTGRQAVAATTEPSGTSATQSAASIADAENLVSQSGWAAKLAAINIIKQVGSDKLTPALKNSLWDIAKNDTDATHRLAAVECLPPKAGSQDEIVKVSKLFTTETDERVLSIFIGMLSGASGDVARKIATDVIVALLKTDTSSRPVRRLSDSSAIAALTVLQTVASYDVSSELLDWLNVAGETELVQTTAISLLKKTTEQFSVDVADKIISNEQSLRLFTTGKSISPFTGLLGPTFPNKVLKTYLRELLRSNALAYAPKLLAANWNLVVDLLTNIWELSFSHEGKEAAILIFQQILESDTQTLPSTDLRLRDSLRGLPNFQARILPYLRSQLKEQVEQKKFTEDQAKIIEATLATWEVTPEPPPTKPKSSLQDFLPNLPNLAPKPRGSSSVWDEWNPGRTIAWSVVGILLFLPGLLFYKADLPVPASFGTIVESRLLLLLLDGLIIYAITRIGESSPNDRFLSSTAFYVLMFPLVYAIYYTHTKYIGPLHFWWQVLQLIINWPTLMVLLLTFRLLE